MTSAHSSKGSKQNITSNRSGTTDALSWERSSTKTRSKDDVLSWEGSSAKATNLSSAHIVHQSAKSKTSANTRATASDQISKIISHSDVPSTAATVVPSSYHHSSSTEVGGASSRQISTPQSKVTAQLLEQDNIWYKMKEQFPVLTEYIQEMELDKQLPQLLTNLFKLKQLPFSPYSQLMCELRPTMERYQQANVTFSQLSTLNASKISLPWAGSVLASCDKYIWGIPSLLQWIQPQSVLQYDWLVRNLEESFMPVYQLNYEIKPIICLSGDTIFGGGLLSQPSMVDIRVEIIITGESEQKVIELFARQIVRDIKSTATITEHNFHLLIEVLMKDSKWSIDSIQNNEDEFRGMIEKNTQDNTPVVAQCVFSMNDDCTLYQFGRKAYTLNFVKSVASDSLVKVFADNQYKTLYSSLVLGEAAGKRYTTLFTPGQRPTRKLHATSTRLSINLMEGKREQDTRPAAINQAEVDKLVESWKKQIAETDGISSLLYRLHKLILLYCVQRGYDDRLVTQIYNISHSPFHWLLVATYKCGYLLKVVHSKVDKNGGVTKALFSQLKKILSSVFNPLIGKVWWVESLANSFFCEHLVRKVWQMNVSAESWEQTSDMKSYHGDLINQINQIDMSTITADNHEELLYVHNYLQGIILGTMEHVMSACPMIKKTITTIRKSFPKVRKQLDSSSKQLQKSKNKDQLKKGKTTFKLFRGQQHDNESQNLNLDNDDIVTDDYTSCFLDVDQLQQYSRFPLPVAKEAILLQVLSKFHLKCYHLLQQYAVDCRIDECIQAFLTELLVCVALPHNPYSTLMSLLKQYHWRLCLYQQTDIELKKKLKHNKEQLDVPSSFLYRLTNEELFGCAPILGVASSAQLLPLVTTVLEDYRNHKCIRVKGLLKVSTAVCLTGPTVLYGNVLPYLFDVTLHEHYLITSKWKNPDEESLQAIALMSDIVTMNVTQLIKLHGLICTGVQLGSLLWSVEDITNKQDDFTAKLHNTLTNKQAIVFKSYYLLDGHYVAIHKHYCMHFFSEVGATSNSYEVFHPTSIQSHYTSVFTNREKALDLYELWFTSDPGLIDPDQPDKPVDPDPVGSSNIKKLTSELDKVVGKQWSDRKYLEAYRTLLLRSIITQQWSQVGEAWNMLHSMAVELEYIQHLSNVLQQLALLPHTSSPDTVVMGTMINRLSIKLQSLLTKASEISITNVSLLDHIKDTLEPYQVSSKPTTGKEASEAFAKISAVVMPLMTTVFQEFHALCKENIESLMALNIRK